MKKAIGFNSLLLAVEPFHRLKWGTGVAMLISDKMKFKLKQKYKKEGQYILNRDLIEQEIWKS